jgi:hypothetical protein
VVRGPREQFGQILVDLRGSCPCFRGGEGRGGDEQISLYRIRLCWLRVVRGVKFRDAVKARAFSGIVDAVLGEFSALVAEETRRYRVAREMLWHPAILSGVGLVARVTVPFQLLREESKRQS